MGKGFFYWALFFGLLAAAPTRLVSAASLDNVGIESPQTGTYSVYYRKDSDEPWIKFGDYRDSKDAYDAAWRLESESGYETFVKFKADPK